MPTYMTMLCYAQIVDGNAATILANIKFIRNPKYLPSIWIGVCVCVCVLGVRDEAGLYA